MSEDTITDNYGNLVDRRDHKNLKVAYDPRVSLNTIIMCLTMVGGVMMIMDRVTASAATTATMQQALKTNEQAIIAINSQRFIDRQELLSELRDIKSEIKLTQSLRK